MSREQTGPKKRLSAQDWIDTALDVIADSGVEAVAVEPLAERLGVTKGSFYAHFRTRDDLVVAALDQWKATETARIEALVDGENDPGAVLASLIGAMFGDYANGRLYAGICAAGADPLVTPYALGHALDKMEIFTDLYRKAGLSKVEAARRAELTYTAYMGHWRIKAMFPPEGAGPAKRYVQHLTRTLIPH